MKVYILASTERPDPYINVLACLFKIHEKKESISEIILLQKKEEKIESRNSLKNNIQNKLQLLSKGVYNERECLLPEDKEYYNVLLTKFNSCSIVEKEMEDSNYYIEILRKSKNKQKLIFDITTLKKDTLINVVCYFLSNKINNVYYFDMLKTPQYNEKDLIHNLTQKDFSYENVFESKHIKKSISKLTELSTINKRWIGISGVLGLLLFLSLTLTNQYVVFIGIIGSIASLISLAPLLMKKN